MVICRRKTNYKLSLAALVVVIAVSIVASPIAAEELNDEESFTGEQENTDEYRYAPPGPVIQAHLGIGSSYQGGLGVEWFSPLLRFDRGFVERGLGFELISEWRNTGFQNVSMLGRIRAYGGYYLPLVIGLDLFAGVVTTGDQLTGAGGFSIHVAAIYFDFGYRHQRVFVPSAGSEWFGRHFFFIRFGFPTN